LLRATKVPLKPATLKARALLAVQVVGRMAVSWEGSRPAAVPLDAVRLAL
jgi:hypothetical protein